MQPRRIVVTAALLMLPLITLIAVTPLSAQSAIPVRQISAAEAVSKESVGSVSGVRELSTGEVLVNDAGNRRVVIFDRALQKGRVVADSTPQTRNMYGKRPTLIIPYTGDTTLLIDAGARALLVMTPAGNVTRVMSPPRPNDVQFMSSAGVGQPGFDNAGHLIYRGFLFPSFKAPVAGKPYEPPAMSDSAPILRGDFVKRSADTLAWIRIPKMRITVTPIAGGGVTLSPVVNPLANVDDWTLLPDGTIAVLRGQDYHIDWFNTDGTRVSSPKMPFDWKRLTDEEKAAIVDSTKRAVAKNAQTPAGQAENASAATAAHGGAPPAATGGGGGGHGMTIMPITANDGGPAPQTTIGANTAIPAIPEVGPASDLPDYIPPVLRAGQMKSDSDGNVWILPSTTSQAGGGLLYDVINRKGEVFQRVRLPAGRALEGFGPHGVVYMTSHVGTVVLLERARINQ